jgi:diguanylate cyclase (GGDEF)-like protein/putative nucleotidyltransferase with HDIG domain
METTISNLAGVAASSSRSASADRVAVGRAPRSRLLLVVYFASLVILLTLGGGLAILASAHVTSSAISASASADRALVQAVLDDLGTAVSSDALGPSASRRTDAILARAVDDVGLVGIALAAPDGAIRSVAGDFAWPSSPRIDLGSRQSEVVLIDDPAAPRLVEAFPISADGQVVAIVGIVRDGAQLLATADAARRDIAIGTLAGATVLVVVLFLVFRGAQHRLDGQTEQLLESARHDPLTGLLTRGAAISVLSDALQGDVEQPIAIALIDIDNFTRLNDLHGHALGDRALRAAADILVGASAPGDAVGRSGPDEFLLVVPGVDASGLARRMEDVRRQFDAVVLTTEGGDHLPLTVSVGIGVAPLHGRTPTELLSAVAVTLGEAKSGGGNHLVISRLSYAELAQERRTSYSILDGLVHAVDIRDRYTRQHSEDVARYALFLARQVGLDDEQQAALHMAALLHDVGKIAIPDDILRKPGHLTREEMEVVKQHVELGAMLVRDLADAEAVAEGVRYHHERWDGTGYGAGLEGEAIPLIARIISIADAFSAMTTSRPYRHALTPAVALARLTAAAGTQLDPRLVDVFVLAMESQAEPPVPSDVRRPTFWLALEPLA